MTALLLLVNALVALLVVLLILLQRTDPASGGMFGGTGGAGQPVVRNPLARPTAILAGVFLVNCLAIAYFTKGHESASSIMGHEAPAAAEPASAPALPANLPNELPAAAPTTIASPTT